jgi:hypothetical protein
MLRPGILLYDEENIMGEDTAEQINKDLTQHPDLLIIMGTSLKITAIKTMVKLFSQSLELTSHVEGTLSQSGHPYKTQEATQTPVKNHRRCVILVNHTPAPRELLPFVDFWVEGDTDKWVLRCESDWAQRMNPVATSAVHSTDSSSDSAPDCITSSSDGTSGEIIAPGPEIRSFGKNLCDYDDNSDQITIRPQIVCLHLIGYHPPGKLSGSILLYTPSENVGVYVSSVHPLMFPVH